MNIEFETKLTYNRISFQRSNRLSIDEREIHTYHEILFTMDTSAVLFTEKRQRQIRGDTLLLIPKEHYHLFRIPEGAEFSRLKIYFPADVLERTPCRDIMSGLRVLENPDRQLLSLLHRLCRILEGPENEKQGFYAYSAFLMLLTELDSRSTETVRETGEPGVLEQITRCVLENLSGDLTVNALAKRLHLSPSGITHLFKQKMGIPVHQYVTQRRMIHAQRLLQAGEKPTKIFTDCGYKDYSSFYKAYTAFFGHPPSGMTVDLP